MAILLIAGALLINPAAKEEIENGGIISTAHTGTVKIHVKNPNMFVEKNYTLYEDGKVIRSFNLGAKEYVDLEFKKSWSMVDYTKSFTYTIRSTELGDLIHHEETKVATLSDGRTVYLDLST